MTPREIYFILSSLGFGVYMALALSTIFRHGWRYPYNWYAAIMLYLSTCCFTFMPYFDFIFNAETNLPVFIAHNVAASMLAPLLMTAFLRLAQPTKIRPRTVFLLWIPFLLFQFFYHFVSNIMLMTLVCFIYVVGIVIWWYVRIKRLVKFYLNRPIGISSASVLTDISWMTPYALIITVFTIIKWGAMAFLPLFNSDWTQPQLVLSLIIYLPLIIFYEFQYSKKRYFESCPSEMLPQSDFDPTTLPQQNELRAAQSHLHSRSSLPPNAILPNLTANNPDLSSIDNEDDAHETHAFIQERLTCMETESLFFLDKEITVASLAQQLGVSRVTLSSYFHDCGTTFFDYIERLRVTYAANLICAMPDSGIDLIAFKSGFTSRSNFNRSFSNHFHCNPDDYRKKNQQ